MTSVKFVDHVADVIEEKMRKNLIKYEHRHGIDVNYKKFALVLSDENKEDEPIGQGNELKMTQKKP